MADNVPSNPGAGAAVRCLVDASGVEWAAGVVCYATTVSAGANVLSVVTATNGLPVAQQGAWAVTASAGTNLNTSLLALESGGHLASLDGKVTTCNTGAVTLAAGAATIGSIGNTTFAATQSGTWNVTSAGNAASGAADSGNPVKVGGVYHLSGPTFADGQRGDLQLDSSGNVKVNVVVGGGGSGGTASTYGASFPSTGTAAGFTDGTSLVAARAFDLDSGAGTQVVLGVGLRLSASGGSVEAGTGANPLRTDPTGTTTQPVSGTFWQATQPVSGAVTANAGTGTFAVSAASLPLPSGASTSAKQAALGTAGTASADVLTIQGIASMTAVKVDGSAVTQPVSLASVPAHAVTQSGTWTVQPGNTANTTAWLVTGSGGTFPVTGTFWQATQPVSLASLPALAAGSATIGAVTPAAAATGGATPNSYLAAASANQDSQVVKNSAGSLYSLALSNPSAAARYVKVYDKATAPTSADTPVLRLFLPAGGGSNLAPAVPVAFAAGIAFRITTGVADADTGAATANDVIVAASYK